MIATLTGAPCARIAAHIGCVDSAIMQTSTQDLWAAKMEPSA